MLGWIISVPPPSVGKRPGSGAGEEKHVVDFISEQGYEIKFGLEEEYQQWLIDHRDELKRAMPAGVEYLGSYAVVMGNGYEGGSWRDLLRLDSYAALDRIAAESKDPETAMGRLFRESVRFVDVTRHPERWTQVLMKNVIDATVIATEATDSREPVGAAR
jgi:hypothetical protein